VEKVEDKACSAGGFGFAKATFPKLAISKKYGFSSLRFFCVYLVFFLFHILLTIKNKTNCFCFCCFVDTLSTEK
jgi:hypothetical protein